MTFIQPLTFSGTAEALIQRYTAQLLSEIKLHPQSPTVAPTAPAHVSAGFCPTFDLDPMLEISATLRTCAGLERAKLSGARVLSDEEDAGETGAQCCVSRLKPRVRGIAVARPPPGSRIQ